MTDAVLQAAAALADAIDAENAALRALDVPRAVAGFARKAECARRLEGEIAASGLTGAQMRRAECRTCAARLQVLVEENRRLLERAMFVQARLIATLARAVPKARVGYGGTVRGGACQEGSAPAMTLSAHI